LRTKHPYTIFEKAYPSLAPLIHELLRAYEGIFDQPTSISEKNLAFLLRRPRERVIAELQQLQAHHIIDNIPRKDTPQLYFFHDRARAEELHIDPVGYRLRKEQYATRIRVILGLPGKYGAVQESFARELFRGQCGQGLRHLR